jgi:hypothetical protein
MILTKTKVVLAIIAASVMPFATGIGAADSIKSYNNDRFGFAFDYPASWSLVEKHEPQSGEALLSLKLLSPDDNVPVRRDYSPGSVGIEVFANPMRRPLREWLDEHGWPFDANGRSVTDTSIGGLPALEVATGKMFAPNRFTYVANEEWVLRLSALAPDSQSVVQSIRFHP